ncbi:MAG: hypothetical protein IPM14_04075 [bacterium]|nr:hypothetical protein [bacterium]
MLKLLITGIIALTLISAFLIIIRNKPDMWFWIFLNLFFDPGGYVYGFLGGTLLGPLHASDVYLAGMIICSFNADINWKSVFQDPIFRKYLLFLFLFALYYFIVYGGVAPYIHNDLDYQTFLMKNRTVLYSLMIIILVYAFSLRDLYHFYTATLLIGTICLTLFIISLLTGAKLIPIDQSARYTGEETMRISMLSYGLFDLLFPLSLIVLIMSKKIKLKLKYRNWLYYSGGIMLIILLLTLTKRTQIDIVGMILIIVLIISYLLRMGKLSSLLKIIFPALLIILVMNFTFPKYASYITDVGKDIFLLMTTGKDSRGKSDQRVTGNKDYELVKKYIENNLLLGTGYTYLYWKDGRATSARGEEFSVARDAAGEVPIYFLFFGYGISGAVLMIPLYFMMLKLFFKMIKLLRLTLIDFFQSPLSIIFSIYFLLSIATIFTYKLWNLSNDFTYSGMTNSAVLMGIGLALYRNIYLIELTNNYKK